MILIFKTNDLLRGIESSLGTKNSMSTFIQMSRACFKVIQEKQLLSTTSAFARSVCVCIFNRNSSHLYENLNLTPQFFVDKLEPCEIN